MPIEVTAPSRAAARASRGWSSHYTASVSPFHERGRAEVRRYGVPRGRRGVAPRGVIESYRCGQTPGTTRYRSEMRVCPPDREHV